MRDIEDMIREDKRRAAIHEAGHLTVARALGCNGWTCIYPAPTNDVINEMTWAGHFRQMHSEADRPEIGVAGIVAECWVEDPDTDAWSIAELIDIGSCEPSDSDMRLIHGAVYEGGWPEISEDLISIALERLREYKPFFDWAVAELMNNYGISDGKAKDHFEQLLMEQRN